jgi:hypothetical protein
MTRKLTAAVVLFLTTFATHAQSAKPNDGASMVKPPPTPGAPSAGTTRPGNPDDMPVKRPPAPPGGDRMLHNNPASDAIAK